MWNYRQSSGVIADAAKNLVGVGYSGRGIGLNNPDMQSVPFIGPIPQGLWSIGPPQDTDAHGPYVLSLIPHADTETFGRDGFLIHGDSIENAGKQLASQGCIVADRDTRQRIWDSGDHVLLVAFQ